MIDITSSEIKQSTRPDIYRRGLDYYNSGRVTVIDIGHKQVKAIVDGSRSTGYAITIIQNGSTLKAFCTCPYDMGGVCKHVVAVLLEVTGEKKAAVLSRDKTLKMSYDESVHLLEDICNSISKSRMEQLVKLWGIDGIEGEEIIKHKKEVIDSIIMASDDPAKLEQVLAGLPEDEYDFIEYLSSMDFVISRRDAEVAVGYWEIDEIFRSLRSKCLLTMIRAPGIYYAVPPHMHDALRSAIEKRSRTPLDITKIRDVKVNNSILSDIMVFLFYTEKNRVQLTRHHNIYKRTARKMASMLSINNQDYFSFIRGIIAKLRLVRASSFQMIVNRKEVSRLFKKKKTDIMNAVIAAAFDMSTAYYGWNTFKSIFKDVVESTKKDEWYLVEALYTELKRKIIKNPKSSLRYWSLADRKERLMETLVSLNLAGALELGLLDTGEIYALRLTESGAAFFTGRKEDGSGFGKPDSSVPYLYVQPNFEVTALLDGVPIPVLFTLNRFAELRSINEHTATFMISKDSVISALENGIKAADIIKSLKQNSKTSVPQNVLYDIEEWASGFDRVFIEETVVLKADKESLLEDIIRLFGSGIIERLGPTSVAVRPSAVKEITGKLKKMNIYPRVKIRGKNTENTER